ncbi:MAG TPA: biotin--[acetyl-CoA-carboxylase] ligase, partial [Anaerolineae bacterium]|nr:biotin--[acetyl-CoA-carboxylase] ligase [Anaerolineae bacterium]
TGTMPHLHKAPEMAASLPTQIVGHPLIYLPSVGSTQDVARDQARAGAPEGLVVVANKQTAGRGRLHHQWWAPAGTSLLLSILFRPSLIPSQTPRLTMICGLAVTNAISTVTGMEIGLKWPNDLLLKGKKLGGILAEAELSGHMLAYAIVGVGINVNLDFTTSGIPELKETAISLSQALGKSVDRLVLLRALLLELDTRYQRLRRGELPHQEWSQRLVTLGQDVRVITPEAVIQGRAVGVNAEGALLIEHADGTQTTVWAGDVTMLQA